MRGREAIVRIETPAGWGTGTLIDPRTILTAFHVVAPRHADKSATPPFKEVVCVFADKERRNATLSEHYDAAADWALLDCAATPAIQHLQPAFACEDDGEWETYGFPSYRRDGTNLGGHVSGTSDADGHMVLELGCREVSQIRESLVAEGVTDFNRRQLIQGVSGAPCIIKGTGQPIAVIVSHLHQLAAGKLLALPLRAIGPLSRRAWDEGLRKCRELAKEPLNVHFDARLYIDRSLESEIERFLASEKTMLIVVGDSGLGKTTLLHRIREKELATGNVCIAVESNRLPAPVNEVEPYIVDLMCPGRGGNTIGFWRGVEREATEGGDRRAVLIVDAVNEYNSTSATAPSPLDFLTKLDQLAAGIKALRLSRIKYIVSCRSELWRRGGSDRMRASTTGDAYYVTDGKIAHVLGRYSFEEARNAYDVYSATHRILTRYEDLAPITRYYLRDPLLLRLTCNVHAKHRHIPRELDSSALFAAYLEHVQRESSDAANTLSMMVDYMFTADDGTPGSLLIRDAIPWDSDLARRNPALYEHLRDDRGSSGGRTLRAINVIRPESPVRFTYDRFAQYLLSERLLQRIQGEAERSASPLEEVAIRVLRQNLVEGRRQSTRSGMLRRTLRRLQDVSRDYPKIIAQLAASGEPGLALVVSAMAAVAAKSSDGIDIVSRLLAELGDTRRHPEEHAFPVADAIHEMLLDEEYAAWRAGQPPEVAQYHLGQLYERFIDCLRSERDALSTPAIQYAFFLWRNEATRSHARAITTLAISKLPPLGLASLRRDAVKLFLGVAAVNVLALAEIRDRAGCDEVLEATKQMMRQLGLTSWRGDVGMGFASVALRTRVVEILDSLPYGVSLPELRRVLSDPEMRGALRAALLMLRPADDAALDSAAIRRLGAIQSGFVLQILSYAISVRYERATAEERGMILANIHALFWEELASPGLRYAIALSLYHINCFGSAASAASLGLLKDFAVPLLHDHKGHFTLGDRQLNYNIIGTLGRCLRVNGHLVGDARQVAKTPVLQYALDALGAAKRDGQVWYYHYVCDSVGLLGVLVDPRDVLEIAGMIFEDLKTLGNEPGFDGPDVVSQIRKTLLRSLANVRALARLDVDRYVLDVLDDPGMFAEVVDTVPRFDLALLYSWTAEQLVFRYFTWYHDGFGEMFLDACLAAIEEPSPTAAVGTLVLTILKWGRIAARPSVMGVA